MSAQVLAMLALSIRAADKIRGIRFKESPSHVDRRSDDESDTDDDAADVSDGDVSDDVDVGVAVVAAADVGVAVVAADVGVAVVAAADVGVYTLVTYECEICLETGGERVCSVEASVFEQLISDKDPCYCAFCDTCLRKYIDYQLSDPFFRGITCPSCDDSLTFEDVERIYPEIKQLYIDKMVALQKTKEELEDSSLSEWIKTSSCSRCPKCSCPIEKSEGCDSMICVRCGTEFSYKSEGGIGSDADEDDTDDEYGRI